MQIETQFSLRDKVFYVSRNHCEIVILCTLCNDTKQVLIAGETFTCPKCKGNHASRYRERWYVVGQSMIGKITFEHEIKMGNCNYDTDESVTQRRKETKTEIQYMLADTGIGSGTCWDEEFLFLTNEAAQAYCDMKNAEIVASEVKLSLPQPV